MIAGGEDRVVRLRVFCPSQQRSVSYEECERCPALRAVPMSLDQAGACIVCTGVGAPQPIRPADPTSGGSFSSLGRSTLVGSVLGPQFACVRPELSVTDLSKAFVEWKATQLAVVDEDGRLLGTAWRDDLVSRRIVRDPDVELFGPPRFAGDQMDRAATIREDEPVTFAVAKVVHDRVRNLFIVNQDGIVVGTLTDLDLLRWLTRERGRLEAMRCAA